MLWFWHPSNKLSLMAKMNKGGDSNFPSNWHNEQSYEKINILLSSLEKHN